LGGRPRRTVMVRAARLKSLRSTRTPGKITISAGFRRGLRLARPSRRCGNSRMVAIAVTPTPCTQVVHDRIAYLDDGVVKKDLTQWRRALSHRRRIQCRRFLADPHARSPRCRDRRAPDLTCTHE